MKKITILLIFALTTALVACSNEPDIEFSYVVGSEVMFENATALAERADRVFIGEVERISFDVVNIVTGRAPTAMCDPIHITLVTIYDVIVYASYKGVNQDVIRVIRGGGIKGYREHEQLSIKMEAGLRSLDGIYRIRIYPEITPLDVGRAYLFAVLDLVIELDGYNNFVGMINSLQSFIELSDPLITIDNFSNISVASLVSEFGETALAEFEELMRSR